MPWKIEERDGKHCVVRSDTGELVKCHDTRAEADGHLKALYANEPTAKAVALFVPFTKVDEEQRMVYGVATDETLDAEGDIVDYEATKEAVADWRKWANVREMHQPKAVGVAVEIKLDDEKRACEVGAKIVDDGAWEKVKAGVYKGYSIGGKALKAIMQKVDGIEKEVRRVTKYFMGELSLADRPSNPSAVFSLVKREDRQLPLPLEQQDVAKIARREDVSDADIERAVKEYGDVEFADPINKKYPLDSEDHIRAAWNYIHQADNRGFYSADEVKTVEGRIVAAWKKKIDEAGPPAAAEKAAGVEQVQAQVEALRKAVESAGQRTDGLAKAAELTKLAGEVSKALGDLAKMGDDFKKLVGDVAKVAQAVDALEDRLVVVEQTPAGTGPILREIGYWGPGALTGQPEALLQKLLDEATDPQVREYIGQQLAGLRIRAAQQQPQLLAPGQR